MKAFSPTGSQILGTLERLSGRAEIVDNSYVKTKDGVDFEWAYDTEIFYDDQETVVDEKVERLFLAEDGTEWPESKLVLKEEGKA